MASLTQRLASWASELRLTDVPDRVVALAKSHVLSQLAAIRAGIAHPHGRALMAAVGTPLEADPARSACALAGLGSWLNLDDTAYAGHLASSTVAVPLAVGHARGLTGADVLAAVIAANECAARITASATLGPFRGQTAAYTAIAGGICGRLHAERAPAARWVDALGLAMTMPPWTLSRGYLGGDARVLASATSVRMAMDACAAATAGLSGAADILEHPAGFLAAFATVPLPEAVVAGLGDRWHTETLSFKIRPTGPGADSAVDCAIELHRRLGHISPADIVDVTVHASAYTLYADRQMAGHGAGTPPSVLPISVPYTVATALLHGDLTSADFTAPARTDAARWLLAAKVRIEHDPVMTASLCTSDAPFGEAIRLAGADAHAWVGRFAGPEVLDMIMPLAPPARSFHRATKRIPARVEVRLADGRSLRAERDIPVGAAGPETRRNHPALVRAKFLATGGTPEVADAFAELELLGSTELAESLAEAVRSETCQPGISAAG